MGLFFSVDGTKINGTRVGKKRVQLKDGDILGFVRYESSFFSRNLFTICSKGPAADLSSFYPAPDAFQVWSAKLWAQYIG